MPITKSPNIPVMVSTIRSTAKAEITKHVKGVAFSHENLVRPWKKSEDKPDFDVEIVMNTGDIIGYVIHKGTEAEDASISVWQLLNKGTRIRYMKVSKDWVSKTWPGRISSGSGSGHTLELDFKDPDGGIAARNFAENIAKASEVSAESSVEFGYKKGFKQAFR